MRGNVWLSLGHQPHFARYELALYGPARAVRFISRTAVPQVSVEDQRGTGFGYNLQLVGMFGIGLLQGLRQRFEPQVTSRNQPRRAVIPYEVVKEPDRRGDAEWFG